MKSIFKFPSVLLMTVSGLVMSSSASSVHLNQSILVVSEPFSLMIIGSVLIGMGCFVRKMKSDMS